jgi:hypothetical protein
MGTRFGRCREFNTKGKQPQGRKGDGNCTETPMNGRLSDDRVTAVVRECENHGNQRDSRDQRRHGGERKHGYLMILEKLLKKV